MILVRDEQIMRHNGVVGKIDIDNRNCRDEIKDTFDHYIACGKYILQKELGIARSNEISIGKGTWTLQSIDSDFRSAVDVMNISFTGLYASHIFHENRSTSSVIEVQMFTVNQEFPGPDARDFMDRNLIMSAKLNDKFCTRCGKTFDLTDNHHDSCRAHCDKLTAKRGEYRGIKNTNNASDRSVEFNESDFQGWSCCGNKVFDSPGCSLFPHLCKEVMFSVTAEANPVVRIEDIDVTVYNALNISIFPESNNEVKVQYTKSLHTALHKYFSINENLEREVLKEDEKSLKKRSFFKANKSDENEKKLSQQNDSSQASTNIPNSIINRRRSDTSRIISKTLSSTNKSPILKKNQEVLYIKFMRMGDITLEVSTAGFLLNTREYKVCVDPFVLHGKVLDWGRLLYKIEIHTGGFYLILLEYFMHFFF